MSYFMGIDLGTSSVKVLISDERGAVYGVGQKGYPVDTPKMGYAEQDPEIWWQCTAESIREAIARAGVLTEQIEGIGFSGQMHGLVALDRDRQLVAPAIIWMDQRSAVEKDEIREAAGELLTEELLNQPGAGMMVCSLLWLKKHQPDVYERIAYVMLPKDYIRFRLTGIIGSEYSDASATLAFSVKNRCWCKSLISRLGLKEDIWPELAESTQVIGTVCAEAAAVSGLSTTTKVVPGGGDSAMALIGNGIIEEGMISCNIGTASQLAASLTQPLYDSKMRIQTWCHPMNNAWYIQGGTLNGGSVLSWLRGKVLRSTVPFEQLDQEALSVPAGSEGLIFIPYLAGERTPFQDPHARGVFFGLGMKHEQPHLVRAAMEGVMYNLCECMKILDELGIRHERLISSGGGARGRAWKQIQADMLDMPVYTTNTREEACMGAVITAAVGTGAYASVAEACSSIVTLSDTPVLPIRENVKIYKEQQLVFVDLYHSVRQLYQRI
jgi:xylulokinase